MTGQSGIMDRLTDWRGVLSRMEHLFLVTLKCSEFWEIKVDISLWLPRYA